MAYIATLFCICYHLTCFFSVCTVLSHILCSIFVNFVQIFPLYVFVFLNVYRKAYTYMYCILLSARVGFQLFRIKSFLIQTISNPFWSIVMFSWPLI